MLPAAQLPAVECAAAALSDHRSDVAADRDDDAEPGRGCGSALVESTCMGKLRFSADFSSQAHP